MKYLVLLCDGMADHPVEKLGGRTPMQAAKKPNMDALAKVSEVGMCKTVADGMKPGSDVANLAVMGYDARECYTGRSPLEAASVGVDMTDSDVTFRCNLVTLSEDGGYDDKTMVDYSAGDIDSADSAVLMEYLQKELGTDEFSLYPGVSYRNLLLWRGGKTGIGTFTPPHDISGRRIGEYLNSAPEAKPIIDMMRRSYDLLSAHEINRKRVAEGKRPANSIWFWGEGTKPTLESFYDKFGLRASVVSAVDLLKGIGKYTGMNVVDVDGATGYIDTNFTGKKDAALNEFENGADLVYLHIEAPDECGHRFETENKVKSIELIDSLVLGPIAEGMKKHGDFRILIMPDHPTPLDIGTHTAEPVPFMIYDSRAVKEGVGCFCEREAADGEYISFGPNIMKKLTEQL